MPTSNPSDVLVVRPPVCEALSTGRAVVALETTIMTHGLPRPLGLDTALACEQIVRRHGATPATVGVIGGKFIAGLDEAEIELLANDDSAAKTNLSNLGAVLASGGNGATSVSTTILAAYLSGIRVAATGGIGGVHRRFGEHLDISSDLTALERFAVLLVCAGAKSILDVAATREQLETRGIPVIGFGTDAFPLFYSRGRDIPVDARLDEEAAVARAFAAHEDLGLATSMLVVADPPEGAALPAERLEQIIDAALAEAAVRGITGRDVTPYVLDRVREMTGGDSLKANLALIRRNCEIAARVAVALAELRRR